MNSNPPLPFMFARHLHPQQPHVKCSIAACDPVAIGQAGAGPRSPRSSFHKVLHQTWSSTAARNFHLKSSTSPKDILFQQMPASDAREMGEAGKAYGSLDSLSSPILSNQVTVWETRTFGESPLWAAARTLTITSGVDTEMRKSPVYGRNGLHFIFLQCLPPSWIPTDAITEQSQLSIPLRDAQSFSSGGKLLSFTRSFLISLERCFY